VCCKQLRGTPVTLSPTCHGITELTALDQRITLLSGSPWQELDILIVTTWTSAAKNRICSRLQTMSYNLKIESLNRISEMAFFVGVGSGMKQARPTTARHQLVDASARSTLCSYCSYKPPISLTPKQKSKRSEKKG